MLCHGLLSVAHFHNRFGILGTIIMDFPTSKDLNGLNNFLDIERKKKTSQLPFSETIRYHFVIRLVIWFVLALNVCGYKDKYCLFAWNPQDNLCVQKKKMSLAKGFIYRHTNEDIRLTGRTLCLAPFRIISVLLSALKWSLSRDSCQDFFPIALKKFDLNMIALSFRLIS